MRISPFLKFPHIVSTPSRNVIDFEVWTPGTAAAIDNVGNHNSGGFLQRAYTRSTGFTLTLSLALRSQIIPPCSSNQRRTLPTRKKGIC